MRISLGNLLSSAHVSCLSIEIKQCSQRIRRPEQLFQLNFDKQRSPPMSLSQPPRSSSSWGCHEKLSGRVRRRPERGYWVKSRRNRAGPKKATEAKMTRLFQLEKPKEVNLKPTREALSSELPENASRLGFSHTEQGPKGPKKDAFGPLFGPSMESRPEVCHSSPQKLPGPVSPCAAYRKIKYLLTRNRARALALRRAARQHHACGPPPNLCGNVLLQAPLNGRSRNETAAPSKLLGQALHILKSFRVRPAKSRKTMGR